MKERHGWAVQERAREEYTRNCLFLSLRLFYPARFFVLLNGFRANANHRWPVIADSGWLGRKVRQANENVTYFAALLSWEADVREDERLGIDTGISFANYFFPNQASQEVPRGK